MKSISAVQAKFSRLNVKGHSTKLWTIMNEKEKNLIVPNIELLLKEGIIVCFIPNTSYWWLLTNLRLILKENDKISYFYLSEIEKVEAKEIFDNETTKQDCSSLDLQMQGNNVKLKVEENTWYAIYNVLKFTIS